MTAPSHLSEIELAQYAEGVLESAERERVTAHLDDCTECRQELAVTLTLIDQTATGDTRRGVRVGWKPLAVALAAGLAALVVFTRVTPNADEAVVRAPEVGSSDRLLRITAIAPAQGATVSPNNLQFTWHAHGADSYRFTLLLDDGTPAWSLETTDTSLKLPPEVALSGGRTYFWRVDALNDGITASTGVQRLELAR